MLMGQKAFLAGIAGEDSELYTIPQKQFMELVTTIPELGEIVVSAYAARRKLLMEWGEGGIILIGDDSIQLLSGLNERNDKFTIT